MRSWKSKQRVQEKQAEKAAVPKTEDEMYATVKRIAKMDKVTDRVLDRLNEIADRTNSAQTLSIAAGVMQDKARLLKVEQREAEQHHLAIDNEKGRIIAEIIRATIGGLQLGHEAEQAVLRCVADGLRRYDDDKVVAISPALSDSARRAVREHVETELRLALPAPDRALPSSPAELRRPDQRTPSRP